MRELRRGTTLIDLLVSITIVATLFGGIYLVYFSILTSVSNITVRTAAAAAIQTEIETIHNLPYDQVGTVGGVPSGLIPYIQNVTVNNYTFELDTTVRNIDDPFDGTVTGNPPPLDTAPADYKLVEIRATCTVCSNSVAATVTTTVAPKALESASQNGSLFIYALDANGNPISGSNVQVINNSTTPTINLTDTTNASGVLQLVGIATSTQGYQITVTKPGYSTDATYPIGGAGNPNPVKPNATVAAQSVTNITFNIDRLSTLLVSTADNRCNAIGNESFSINGSKLIGTNPNILKFSTTSVTGATGSATLANLEWDTYSLALTDASRDLAGTIPLTPLVLNPSSTQAFKFVAMPASDPSLLVTAIDAATGAGIANAVITASSGGFSQTLTAGHAFVGDKDWSSGNYTSQSGGLNASVPGKLTLLLNASGTYNTGTNDWLISKTIDLGSSSSSLYAISFTPATPPAGTSMQFQVAANNNNTTWNFIGPDGTGASYFTASSSLPPSLSSKRYIRYEVFMSTQNGTVTPELDSISFEFSGPCTPSSQALFTRLPQGTYSLNLTAQNYNSGSTTVSVGPGIQTSTVSLIHL